MIYFDTSYLVRCYFEDPGYEAVRLLATTDDVRCSALGRIETLAAFHRKLREGEASAAAYREIVAQFQDDCDAGVWNWISLSPAIVDETCRRLSHLKKDIFLRSGDALHLVCAAENGFREIYSNDKHLLAAAKTFGLVGKNII